MKILVNFLIFFFITSNINASNFTLKKITNLNEPWGSTFINNHELLITKFQEAHIYLEKLDKYDITTDYFNSEMLKFINL